MAADSLKPDPRTAEKLAEAKRKHGKPFAPEIRVQRVAQPSYVLAHINDQVEANRRLAEERKAAADNTVQPMRRRNRDHS